MTNQRGGAEEEAEGRGGAQAQDGAQAEEQGRGGRQTEGGTWILSLSLINDDNVPIVKVEERRRRERENMAGLREALGSQSRNKDNLDVEVRNDVMI